MSFELLSDGIIVLSEANIDTLTTTLTITLTALQTTLEETQAERKTASTAYAVKLTAELSETEAQITTVQTQLQALHRVLEALVEVNADLPLLQPGELVYGSLNVEYEYSVKPGLATKPTPTRMPGSWGLDCPRSSQHA